MGYEVARQWTHGDVPTAAHMNAYSNALNYIKEVLERSPVNPAFLKIGGDPDDVDLLLVHASRWLHVPDGCTIINFNDSTQTENVPEPPSGTIAAFDLNQIDWMLPGNRYTVHGVPWAVEKDHF